MERLDWYLFRYRNLLAGAPLAYAFASTRWESEHDRVIWPLALALCVLGVALRGWAGSHCGYAQGRPKQLTTSGPYAYVRNPLYVANVVLVAGATIASELAWLLPVTLTWASLVYRRAVRHEDRRLRARYGDLYLRYRERVPAWLPRVPAIAPPMGGIALRTIGRELPGFLVLLPFALKELDAFGLWASW